MNNATYVGHRVPTSDREDARMHGIVRWINHMDWDDGPQALPYVKGAGLTIHDWGVSGDTCGVEVLAKSILVDATDDSEAANDSALIGDFVDEFIARFAYGAWTLQRLTVRRWMRGRLMEMESDVDATNNEPFNDGQILAGGH
jgi:hypothetical protein